jgi:hypothetical protein
LGYAAVIWSEAEHLQITAAFDRRFLTQIQAIQPNF